MNYCDVPGCYSGQSIPKDVRKHNATVIHQRREARHADENDVISLIESEREAWAASDPKRHDIFLAFQKRHGPVWNIDMDGFIKAHYQRDVNGTEAYNSESPYITLLKPASYPPNPWAIAIDAKQQSTHSLRSQVEAGDHAIKSLFVDDLKMDIKQVAAHAHTKKKNCLQPLLAITLARYVDCSDIGDFYDEWLQASKVFAFDGAARGGSSQVKERQWRTLDDWVSFDQAVMELRLGRLFTSLMGDRLGKFEYWPGVDEQAKGVGLYGLRTNLHKNLRTYESEWKAVRSQGQVTDVALKKVRSSHYAQDDLGLDEVAERIETDSDAFKIFKVHLNPLAHGYRGQSRGTVSRMCLLHFINLGSDRSNRRWTKEELKVLRTGANACQVTGSVMPLATAVAIGAMAGLSERTPFAIQMRYKVMRAQDDL
ncbi:hypothetical protein HD553DRAFT_347327 [Filobasidium floriforme]|uniref:uncharacterized protein n=1 Tax=Filobasidium floriforme TaxID=5210 RepID=UPI001E8D7CE6|nr:uncharacterized protein HD553DRAFT_347327 [Filobasidium floriforme]KAH8090869.1 hypothetical protein HD553DRAFT_347327 [Filobasidium floriforme]